jgi:hypothetical protein
VRTVYECAACRASIAPLDLELGVQSGEQLTRRVVRKAAYIAGFQSFGDAARSLYELAGIALSRAEFARVVEQEGQRIEALQEAETEKWLRAVSPDHPSPAPQMRPQRLVIEADATCVLTVAQEEHKSVYCGVAFDADARGSDHGGRAFLVEKRYAASGYDMEDFGRQLKALGYRMGARSAQAVAFIADGARPLWNWAEQHLPPQTVLIQDFWHVCEHLSQLAQDLYDPAGASKAFVRWKQWLRQSCLGLILEELHQEHRRCRGEKRKRIQQEVTYLQAGAQRMDYARYEQEGWPIGSGAVEGACKHFIKERFCLTGAHWRRKNIPRLLAIRKAIFNGQWEKYWEEAA